MNYANWIFLPRFRLQLSPQKLKGYSEKFEMKFFAELQK